ncbi:inward rectifier potassium channel family protein [Chloroflexi bacterium TSY]|nr:inward rectifier potassium channel family protein [Chloroflexi bacterium TSY]
MRKGTPRELRADLYFWLIDGSWTRLMVVFGGLFLFLNVVFAALYLLGGDGAIIGTRDDGFLGAFAFSVQTMSTIGFGSLSPGSDYADLLVTIEALVGLLGVALATGLMFARRRGPARKCSSPRTCCSPCGMASRRCCSAWGTPAATGGRREDDGLRAQGGDQ